MWQNGVVSLSPRGVATVAGVEEDALGEIFFGINETHYLECLVLSLVCWLGLRDSIWMIVPLTLARCFSSLFLSLSIHTHSNIRIYILLLLSYFLVLTKPAPAWVPVKASFSTSDTIVTLYRHRSTNRFVSLVHGMSVLLVIQVISSKTDVTKYMCTLVNNIYCANILYVGIIRDLVLLLFTTESFWKSLPLRKQEQAGFH